MFSFLFVPFQFTSPFSCFLSRIVDVLFALFPGSKDFAETQGSGYHIRHSCCESLLQRTYFEFVYSDKFNV